MQLDGSEIVIIGMAGRFPGAKTLDEYWRNLCAGHEAITFFSAEQLAAAGVDPALLDDPHYVRAASRLEDDDLFDAHFFGIYPREAALMDPQQRIFLECAWEALERAGYTSDAYDGAIGVYGGASMNTYLLYNLVANQQLFKTVDPLQIGVGNAPDFLTTRVSYKLNLTGPSYQLQTACSTGLVAVHVASQALLNGECDIALAGSISINVSQRHGYRYTEGSIASPDGHCRAFDASAQGTIFGSGVGVVVLKRLQDALDDRDPIYAVIKGSAINNDGSLKAGYITPSVEGQAAVIIEALANAGLEADAISYVEAHGTGTALGDPVEVQALTRAFRESTSAQGFCALGSVKTNIGHLDAAAGMAGLIKTVLALIHKQIPPSLHFEQPNPQIHFADTPFYVNAKLADWQSSGPRYAGVSAFGFGGTNAHILLQEAPAQATRAAGRPIHLLTLSAKTATALEQMAHNLADFLEQPPTQPLADVAYTLHVGRKVFSHRRALVCHDHQSAIAALRQPQPDDSAVVGGESGPRQVVFLFPGQGAQYVQMGLQLYEHEPVFRDQIDACALLLKPHLGLDLRDVLYPSPANLEEASRQLEQTWLCQPALFVVEYALAKLWMAWGVEPAAMIGHSIGEYVAATLAGVFSLRDALAIVARRGQLMQATEAGAMLSVSLAEEQLRDLLGPDRALAAVNGPQRCVVSGSTAAIDALEEQLAAQQIPCRRLHTSHAFHSPLMAPIADAFLEYVAAIPLHTPTMPYLANLSGSWVTEAEACDPRYWAAHLTQTVRFADGLDEMLARPGWFLLEVGPGRTLSTLARQHPALNATHAVAASMRHVQDQQSDLAILLHTCGKLWLANVPIDWPATYGHQQRGRIALPTYPFERQRYWIEPEPAHTTEPLSASAAEALPRQQAIAASTIEAVPMAEEPATKDQRQTDVLATLKTLLTTLSGIAINESHIDLNFFEMGVDSLLLIQVSQAVADTFGVEVALRQFFDELSTLNELATYIARRLPPPARPAIAATSAPSPDAVDPGSSAPVRAAKLPAGSAATGLPAEMQQLMQQQLEIMARQMALLERMADWSAAPIEDTNSAHQPADPPRSTIVAVAEQQATTGESQPEPFVPYQRLTTSAGPGLPARHQQHIHDLTERYTARSQQSKQLTQRYRLPLANNRNVAGFRPAFKEMIYQIHARRAAGARFWDVDDREYLDLTMGFGTALLGHNPPAIQAALSDELQQGFPIGPLSSLAGPVAEAICELTGVERVAFFNTGTEAVMVAVRVARAVTGRAKIAIFAGSYHGTFDGLLARASVAAADGAARPLAPGIPQHLIDDVLVLTYDTPQALDLIRQHAHELAAVLVEPVQSRRPDVQPRSFLHSLRRITEAAGIGLIFDEVITGFRIHPGGAQAWFGVQADLVTYGKIVGGGMPIGVVAGKAAFMDSIDGGMWSYGDASYPPAEERRTFVAGTFCQHPLAMRAALTVLTHLKEHGPALQEAVNQRTARLVTTLNRYYEHEELPIRMVHFGSLFRFVPRGDLELLYYHLLDKGIYIWEGRNCFLSTAHTDADVDFIIRAVQESIAELRDGGFLPERAARHTSTAPILERQPSLLTADEPAEWPHALPMTAAQQRLWIASQTSDIAAVALTEAVLLTLTGPLDPAALGAAQQTVCDRHEALRTTISGVEMQQQVAARGPVDLPIHDVSDLPPHEQAEHVQRWLIAEAQRPFDLERGPLFQIQLVRQAAQQHLLVFRAHDLIVDGWSVALLLQELGALYSAIVEQQPARLPVPTPFRHYVAWRAAHDDREAHDAATHYWHQQFAVLPPVLELPADYTRARLPQQRGARLRMTLPSTLAAAIARLGAEQRCTTYMVLLASFNVLLHRLSGQTDLVVAIPSAGQAQMAASQLVGQCVTLLPIRTQARPDLRFSDYLATVKDTLLAASDHQHGSLDTLLPALAPSVMFNLDRAVTLPRFGDMQTTTSAYPISAVKYELSLNIVELEGTFIVDVDYMTDLFAPETIQRWLRAFEQLLTTASAAPATPLGTIALAEPSALLKSSVGPEAAVLPIFVHQRFEEQAARGGLNPAVVRDATTLTYDQLNGRANQLAHALIDRGARAGHVVGLWLSSPLDLLTGVIAVLKSGAAYIILDDPATVVQTDMRLLISDPARAPVAAASVQVVCLDWQTFDAYSRDNIALPIAADELACLVANSAEPYGAGRPFTRLTHVALSQYIDAIAGYLGRDTDDQVLLSEPQRDPLFEHSLAILSAGRSLALPSTDPDQLLDAGSRPTAARISIVDRTRARWWTPPSQPATLMIDQRGGRPQHPQWSAIDQPPTRLLSIYRPAAIPLVAFIAERAPNSGADDGPPRVPTWRTISGVRSYVLDKTWQPVPLGVYGAIVLGSPWLESSLVAHPADQAAPFIPNSWDDPAGAALYPTGLVGRMLADGSVELLGMAASPPRIGGRLIEIDAVAAVLRQHPHVREAAVEISRHDGDAAHLIAYVVQEPSDRLPSEELHSWLTKRLPDYLTPTQLVELDALPLLPTGEIDRAALPETALETTPHSVFVAPRNMIEQQIVDICAELLGVAQVSVFDNFFQLGGRSLLAAQFMSRMRDTFQVDVPLRTLLEADHLADLAVLIVQLKTLTTDQETLAEILAEIDELSEAEIRALLTANE